MNVFTIRTASLIVLLGASLSASAQTSFYGGDYDGNSAVITDISDSYARVFDDFTIGTATNVLQIYGNFVGEYLVDGDNTHMYFEIRQGVSDENGGTLLYSGLLNATTTYAGATFGGITDYADYFRVSANVGPGIVLGPGTYFLGLAVPNTYLMTTGGAGATGGFLNNDVSYFDSENFGRPHFESLAQTGLQGATDLSMGMIGRPFVAPGVPGPAAVAPFVVGLVGTFRRRKRS